MRPSPLNASSSSLSSFPSHRVFFFPNSPSAPDISRLIVMASEERCRSPPLCANGCGFFGSSTTLNLCSKCFKEELCLINQQQSVAPIATMNATVDKEKDGGGGTTPSPTAGGVFPSCSSGESAKRRCSRCNKRVRLAGGFKCRCGGTYCAVHRYPEEHECAFDYKASARSAIAKANPVIKAEKLDNI